MPPNKDPYGILGLQPGASESEIKKAWQKASLEHHPDRNPHPDSTQRIQEINNAYEILSDPEKRKKYEPIGQYPGFTQGYCASCSKNTDGKCTHEFKFKPARPAPIPVCHWCRDETSNFQTGLCTEHLWCSRCFVSRYTLAMRDARCCERMVAHAVVDSLLPRPIATLYDLKQASDFEYWRQQKHYHDLCDDVRDWQEANPALAYGLAAAQALLKKNQEIDRLQKQLFHIQINRAPPDKDTQDLKDQLNMMRQRHSALENTCKVLREANERYVAKFSATQKESFARIKQLEQQLRAGKKTKNEDLKTQLADLNANPDHGKFQRKCIVLEASLASAQATIQCLEKELKTAKTSAKPAAAASESNLRDELIRKHTRIAELERSLKIAKDANAKNVQLFSEAQKARNAAENNVAVVKKENGKLTAELAAARSELEQLRQDPAVTSTSARDESVLAVKDLAIETRNKDLEDEVAKLQQELQEQRQAVADRDTKCEAELVAAQKRCEDLEAELATVQSSLQQQEQVLADTEGKHQAELSATQADTKTAVDNEAAAKQELENTKVRLAKAQEEKDSAQTSSGFLHHRTNLLDQQHDYERKFQQSETKSATSYEVDGPSAVAPPQIKIPVLERLKTTQQKVPAETGLGSFPKPYSAPPASALHHTAPNTSSPRAPATPQVTTQQTSSLASPNMPQPLSAPHLKKAVASPTSIPLTATFLKPLHVPSSAPANVPAFNILKETTHDVVTTGHQASQTEATKTHIKPFDFAAYQKALPSFQLEKTNKTRIVSDLKSNTVKPVSSIGTPTCNSTAATENQTSQDTVDKPKSEPFDLAAYQKTMAASKLKPSFDFSKMSEAVKKEDSDSDNWIKLVSPGIMTKDKTTALPASQTEQPKPINTTPQPTSQTGQPTSTASKTDNKPATPTGLLKAQLHYARATQKAAQEDAKRTTEEVLRLQAELKRYKQFEFDAYHEIARANEMYNSLERKITKAKNQPRQSEGALEIPARHFTHPVDDNDKSASELLATMSESFAPMKSTIKRSLAARKKKIEKEQESSLNKSARRNQRLRDTIRQKDQEIEDMRIDYGNSWATLLDNVCAKESEIRRLKKSLHSQIRKAILYTPMSSSSMDNLVITRHGGQKIDGQKIDGSKDPQNELGSEEEEEL
ncbi:hypothetical protein KCU95_g714, partial [Aureobasidium melanogenum]